MIRLDVPAFESFCANLTIPSKEQNLIPFRLWNTQRYAIREIAAGMERGVHEFVILAGRQVGKTTQNDALDLWWPQANAGTQGMLVSDDDGNMQYRRDVILQMQESLPKSHRIPVRINNQGFLT